MYFWTLAKIHTLRVDEKEKRKKTNHRLLVWIAERNCQNRIALPLSTKARQIQKFITFDKCLKLISKFANYSCHSLVSTIRIRTFSRFSNKLLWMAKEWMMSGFFCTHWPDGDPFHPFQQFAAETRQWWCAVNQKEIIVMVNVKGRNMTIVGHMDILRLKTEV